MYKYAYFVHKTGILAVISIVKHNFRMANTLLCDGVKGERIFSGRATIIAYMYIVLSHVPAIWTCLCRTGLMNRF